MLWKCVTALIILFWAVMTTVLVRHTYFPDEIKLTAIPATKLLEIAAQHRNITRSTLTLMHQGKPSGLADLAISEWREPMEAVRRGFHFQAGGSIVVTGKDDPMPSNVSWRFDGDLKEAGGWKSLALAVRSPVTDTNVFLTWKQGDEMPKIEVMNKGKITMDTKAALEMARSQQGVSAGMGMMGSMLPGFLGNQTVSLENLIQVQAESGIISMAGKQRSGLLLTLALMGFYQAKAFYTEAGELTRVDLPQGWQLIDPLLAGIDSHD